MTDGRRHAGGIRGDRSRRCKSAEAAITAAKADANRTAVDLKYTVVKAPISGRIDRAFVTKGNLLTGGQASGTLLTKIVNEQPMYVYFDVDERSLLRYMRQRAATRETAPGSLRELGIPCYVQLADETGFSARRTARFRRDAKSTARTGTARIRGVFANDESRAGQRPVRARADSREQALPGAADSRAGPGDRSEHQVRLCRRQRRHGNAAHRGAGRPAGRDADRHGRPARRESRSSSRDCSACKPGQKVEAEVAEATCAARPPCTSPSCNLVPCRMRPAATRRLSSAQPRRTTQER